MSHGTIIAFSTKKLSKEEWSNDLSCSCDRPNIYADYWGESKNDIRDKILDDWHYDYLYLNRKEETVEVGSVNLFVDTIKQRVEEMLEKSDFPYFNIKTYVMFGEYEHISFYCEDWGVYYTYPELLDKFGGKTLYICGMYDFHM